MKDYRFDMSNFTIGDAMEIAQAAKDEDVLTLLSIANRFIPINLLALPMSEVPIIVQCFYEALKTHTAVAAPDPIDQLIRKALEDA